MADSDSERDFFHSILNTLTIIDGKSRLICARLKKVDQDFDGKDKIISDNEKLIKASEELLMKIKERRDYLMSKEEEAA